MDCFQRLQLPRAVVIHDCAADRDQIWHDMYGVPGKGIKPFPKAPLLSSPPPPPRELSWKIPPELKAEVISASRAFGEACAGYTLEHVEFLDFGKNACKV